MTCQLRARDAVYFVNAKGGAWTALDGSPVPAPAIKARPGVLAYTSADGARYLAHASALGWTPWMIAVELPLATMMERPSAFLKRVSSMLPGMILQGDSGYTRSHW